MSVALIITLLSATHGPVASGGLARALGFVIILVLILILVPVMWLRRRRR